MYKFPNLRLSHVGTLTGRFFSSLPIPTYSNTPKSGWFKHQQQLINQSKFWDALLKIDYSAIESTTLKKSAQKHLGSALGQSTKPITIMGKPIDITALETFKVELSMPPQIYADYFVSIWQDKLQEIQPCQCEMQILMSVGCRCGGA